MKAGIKDSTYFDGGDIRFYVKDNRTTTAVSLQVAICLMFSNDKEQFCKFYRLATHDDCRAGIWYYLSKPQPKEIKSTNRIKPKRETIGLRP